MGLRNCWGVLSIQLANVQMHEHILEQTKAVNAQASHPVPSNTCCLRT